MANPKSAMAALRDKYGTKKKDDEEKTGSAKQNNKKEEPVKPTSKGGDEKNSSSPKAAMRNLQERYGGSKYLPEDKVSGVSSLLDEINSLSKRVNDDYTSRDGKYQPSVQFGRYTDDTQAEIGRVKRQAEAYRKYFDENRSSYDSKAVDEILKVIDDSTKWLTGAHDSLGSERDYWNQWESEDAYNEYTRLMDLDLDASQKQYDALKKQLEQAEWEMKKAEQGVSGYNRYGATDKLMESGKAYGEKSAIYNELSQQAAALQRDIYNAQRYQDSAKYSAYLDAPDFSSYTGKATSDEAALIAQRDALLEEREKLVSTPGSIERNRSRLNEVTAQLEKIQNQLANLDRGRDSFEYMDESEQQIYNYLLAKDGDAAAQEYLDHLQEAINYRKGTERGEEIRGIESDVGRFLATGAYGLWSGIEGFGQNFEQRLSDELLATSPTQYASSYIADDLSKTGSKIPGMDKTWGEMGYEGLSTIGNMAPSILVGAVSAKMGVPQGVSAALTAITMGTSASGGAYAEKLKEGYTKEQARTYGDLVGLSEGALSYFLSGISALSGAGNLTTKALTKVQAIDNGLIRAVAAGAIKGTGEVVEEELQLFLEPLYASLIMGEEYTAPEVEDIVYTAVLTYLTTGVLEAPEIISYGLTKPSNAMRNMEAPALPETLEQAALEAVAAEAPASPVSEVRRMADAVPTETQAPVRVASEAMQTASMQPVSDVSREAGQVPTQSKNARTATVNDPIEKLGYGEHGKAVLTSLAENSDMSVEQLNSEFHLPYLQGLSNKEVLDTNFTTKLQQEAFNAGKLDRIANMNVDTNKAKFATVHGKESGLIANDASRKFDQKVVAALNKASKVFGTKSMVVGEVWQKDGKIVAKGTEGATEADAAMRSDGVLLISANASDPLLTLVKHEFTHRFQQLAPKEYREYRDAVTRFVVDNDMRAGGTVSTLEGYQNELGLNVEKSADEIAADFTEYFLKNPDEFSRFVDELLDPTKNTAEQVKQNRNFIQRLIDSLKEFAKKVRNALAGNTEAAKRAEEIDAQIKTLEQKWKDAAKASAEAVKKVESGGKQEYNVSNEAQMKMKDGDRDGALGARLEGLHVGSERVATDGRKSSEDARRDGRIHREGEEKQTASRLLQTEEDIRRRAGSALRAYFKEFYNDRVDEFFALYDDNNEKVLEKLFSVLDGGKEAFVDEFRGVLPEVEMLADRLLAAIAVSDPSIILPSGGYSKQDEPYFAAIRKGDYAAAEKMVEEAARANGYTLDVWHGSDTHGITVFRTTSSNEFGLHVGSREAAADRLNDTVGDFGATYHLYMNPGRSLQLPDIFGEYTALFDYVNYLHGNYEQMTDVDRGFDFILNDASDFPKNKAFYEMAKQIQNTVYSKARTLGDIRKCTELTQKYLKTLGYDSFYYKNMAEDEGSTSYIVLDPERVKSAEVMTFADDGKVIPLSERFNAEKDDIRFSTKGQQKLLRGVTEAEAVDGDVEVQFSMRKAAPPKKTELVYKLMRLKDGKIYPLFIDSTESLEVGKWYDADSPNLDFLKKLPSGIFLVDADSESYVTYDEYLAKSGEKKTKYPSKKAVEQAAADGKRWVFIEDAVNKKGEPAKQKRFGGETRRYWNLGINGSGAVGTFSMRPGYHAGSLPTMRQIGKGANKDLRDDTFVWTVGRVPADIDYQAEANSNPDKDIPTHIPTDGYYLKATNADKAKSQADVMGWYVAGSYIIDRIISDAEARSIIDKWNAEHPDAQALYDYERESGMEFDAKQMKLVPKGEAQFSMKGQEKPILDLADIKAAYKDKTDHLYLHERGDTVTIDNLVVKKEFRNKGIGTQILDDVIAYADKVGKTITLTPTSEYGTKARLTKWYKANGFVENKGRNADYRLSDTMYRLPRTGDDWTRFSAKGQRDLLEENLKLKEVNDALRDQFKTTKFAKVDKKSLDAFAKRLLKDYQSGADINETRKALDALYTYIANGENGESPVWNEAYKRAYDTAVEILEQSSDLDDEMYQAYKSLRDEMRTRGISLSKEYDGDLTGYESINEFRKAHMGSIKMTNDGTPVDVVYADLANRYPEFFNEEEHSNQADQLMHIAEVLDSLKPVEVNRYAHNMRESATWLANDIMERFFELPQAKPTFADKAQQKLTKQVIKDAKKLENLREQKNERIAQIIKREKDRVGEVRKVEREKRSKAVKQVKEYYLGKQAAGSERRNSAVLRKRIAQHASDLSKKLLRPTDNQHIPESLRTTVAAVLEAINLESQYTVDPVTGKRTKNGGGDPTKRTKAFQELKAAYKQILKEEGSDMVIDPSLLGNAEEGFDGYFDAVLGMSDTKLADMSLSQLEIMWRVIRAVERSVSTAGKMLASQKFESTVEWAGAFEEDTDTRRRLKGSKTEAFRLDLENPFTFFSHYGKAGEAVFRMLRDAQDAQQRMVEEVNEEVRKIVDPKQVKKWEKEVHEFKTARGEKLVLTVAHMMEIHELMKREQARDHLTKGGIVQPEIKSKKINRGTDAILLSLEDIMAILKPLTKEQMEVADKLQALTSGVLAKYGNEASMRAYGYEKFTGTDYWPIKSAREGVHSNVEKGGSNTRSIKNIGLAKAVMPHASNALDIGGIFSTFSSHAADMTDYAAWLCPMEDANRIYNFKFRDENGQQSGMTMKGLLDRYGGKDAQKYWERLVEDIQNGISKPEDTAMMKPINKAISNVRAASVGANIRVIVQQPTAIIRAAAVLNPVDMTKGLAGGATKGNGWKKALKYSDIAKRKDMGGFDISSPAQMNEILFDSQTGLQKFNEAMMWGAGKADAVTWGKIWNACEWAVNGEGKLELGSKEFYERVSELFTEVIDQSQVVDGVLQRSQMMRSSNALAKQATAFMGEPTMALNMLLRSYDNLVNEKDAKKRSEAFKKFGRAASVLLVTNVVNAAAQSLVDAIRDDEDEEYWKKFKAAFTGLSGEEETAWEKASAAVLSGNVGTSLLPAGYVPFVKDVVSILQGYNVTRADADIMADIVSAWQTFSDSALGGGKKTIANATWNLAKQVGKVFGISAPNMTRDIYGMLRTIALETGNIPAQYEMEKWIYKVSNDKNVNRFVDLLYKAYTEDQEVYQHIYDDMKASGFNMEKIQNRMETNMKGDQGVTKVGDLEQRYLHPDQQIQYDSKLGGIQSSGVWSKATEEQRDDLESDLYDLVVQNSAGEDLAEKIADGKSFGLDETEYLLYRLALDVVDQPNKSGELGGSPTNAEKAAAIDQLSSLGGGEIAYLWDTKDGYEAYAAGVDMRTYVKYIGDGKSVSVEKLIGAKDVGISDDEYYDFLDALDKFDTPSKSGKLGTFTQDEATMAVASIPGLTSAQRAYLWQSMNKSWKSKNNPWR